MSSSTRRKEILSSKQVAVIKANAQVIVLASLAVGVAVFAFFAGISIIDKIRYQNMVLSERNKASQQLERNIESTQSLVNAYLVFDGSVGSVIGTADKNSKIVLDALPSKYDFPALATSLEAIVKESGLAVTSISGRDEEATAQQSSVDPQLVTVPFEISATGSYESVQKLIKDMERSIRPFDITNIRISGAQDNLSIRLSAVTYYLPARELGIVEKTIKSSESSQSRSVVEANVTDKDGL